MNVAFKTRHGEPSTRPRAASHGPRRAGGQRRGADGICGCPARLRIRPCHQPGFTLIEVLIALAVVALALLALTRTAGLAVQDFDALRERTLAGWMAANVLTDTRIAAIPPPLGRSDGRAELGGHTWRWTREVLATPNASIRRIEVQVFLGTADQPSASLTGFAGVAP